MNSDFELLQDGSIRLESAGGALHGGARRGAGRPRKTTPRPVDIDIDEGDVDDDQEAELLTKRHYEAARARNELAKAQMNEIALRVQTGRYVARSAVERASATILATLAQTLRSIPDSLERKGIPPDVCVMVEDIVNDALNETANDLELLARDPVA